MEKEPSEKTEIANDIIGNANGEKLQTGVVHLKNFLNITQQQQLWTDIIASAYTHTPTQATNPKSKFTKIIAFNCNKQYDAVPQSFKDYSSSATLAASKICDTIPPDYKIDYITSFKYPKDEGCLTGHCDKIEGWVVLFSLGCTARFYVKGPEMSRKTTINFESGDALIFNGGTEYDIFHGIDEIRANTCPLHLPDLTDMRVSIQFRQTGKNDNKRYRGPKKY